MCAIESGLRQKGHFFIYISVVLSFSEGLRPGSKACSENMNDWQYLSLGDLEQNAFFPKSKS